jgi:hypothetical protein
MTEPKELKLVAECQEHYLPWTGYIGEEILNAMAEDNTLPAQAISSWIPLGSPAADLEEAVGMNGTTYRLHIESRALWRYPAR